MFGDATYQLLATMALPVIAGLTCLVVVMLQAPGASREPSDKTSPPPAQNPSDTLGPLSLSHAYDPDRNVLWDNQIVALQLIGSGAAIPELLALWKQYVHLFPELFEQTSFWDWIAFLRNCNLIGSTGNVIRLTSNGREFLNLLICNSGRVAEEWRLISLSSVMRRTKENDRGEKHDLRRGRRK